MGWCYTHYGRWHRFGNPLRERPSPTERFWAKVNKGGPVPTSHPDLGACWLWTAGETKYGYGKFTVSADYRTTAHRFSYETAIGPITNGMWVLHRCNRPLCVNPAHLYLGDHSQNMDDRQRAGHYDPEAQGTAKLTWGQVREMRALRPTLSTTKLMERYGVSRTLVKKIIRGDAWREPV